MVDGSSSMGGFIKCEVFPDTRLKSGLPPLFSDGIVSLLHGGIHSKVADQHPFRIVTTWLFTQLECHSLSQDRLRLSIDMQGCDYGFSNKTCELGHFDNMTHDGNIGICIAPLPLGFNDNQSKFLYKKFTMDTIQTKQQINDFDSNVPSLQYESFINQNLTELYSNNWNKINTLSPFEPYWNDINWNNNILTKLINLINKYGPDRETVERHIVHRMQTKNKIKKMLKTVDDVMNKIWNQHKEFFIMSYDSLQSDISHDSTLNQILNVCKTKTGNCDIDVIIEWILSKIDKSIMDSIPTMSNSLSIEEEDIDIDIDMKKND